MANQKHVAILRQGVEVWNQWRKASPEIEPDLSETHWAGAYLPGAYLSRANLFRINFERANLSEANLERAYLRSANLTKANLGGAYLSEANLFAATFEQATLEQAHLTEANLFSVNFRRADLRGADLRGANLEGANLEEAKLYLIRMGWTAIGGVNLNTAYGLHTVQHRGPSSIGANTIFLSGGDIPEVFLRGCGVPDSMIEYARALVAAEQPIDYYSVFISYSSRDDALARRLHADLQAAGVRCWYAPHDLPIGARIRVGIDEAIRLHDKLLLLLSKHSVASDWVEKEVETAMEQERRQKRTVLFPIRLDKAVMDIDSGWPADVRRGRNIGDFSKWKQHDAYQAAFARLLRDLKAEQR